MTQTVPIPLPGFSSADWQLLPINERAILVGTYEYVVKQTEEEPLGSDRGPRVDAMLRAARSRPGQPWSAAFVTWCLAWAGWNPCSDIPGAGVAYPSSVVSWVCWARRTGRWKDGSPARGDLFYFDLPGRTHMGFVADAFGAEILTIEGDASEGDRLGVGDQVLRRSRLSSAPQGFISLRDLVFRA